MKIIQAVKVKILIIAWHLRKIIPSDIEQILYSACVFVCVFVGIIVSSMGLCIKKVLETLVYRMCIEN